MHRSECQKEVTENADRLRKVSDHQKYLDIIAQSDVVDLKQTKGLKRHCIFNQLNHFHMYVNLSVDIMHDVHEGVIPFFINTFHDSLHKNRILSLKQIQQKVRDYNYGHLNKNYKPSPLKFEGNLNQNAKQLCNLMSHLPFIFIDQRTLLTKEWDAMVNLLQIIQKYLQREKSKQLTKISKLITTEKLF